MSHVQGKRLSVLGLFALLALTSSSPGQDAAQVTAARRLIETERKTIFFTMHPTPTLKRTEYDGARKLKDGFVLTYTFHFQGLLGTYYSKMDFTFNDRGRFAGLETNETTSPAPPFFASDLAMGVLKDMVKDDFELKKDGAVAKALDAADSKLVLELILTARQSKLKAGGGKNEELIRLIRSSESMDDKERQEWIDRLPVMTADQRAELRRILVNEKEQQAAIDRKYTGQTEAAGRQKQETAKANDLFARQDYRGAITVLTASLGKDPRNSDALFYRGQAYQAVRAHREAVEDFSKVIEMSPTSSAAFRKRAYSHNALGHYRGAMLDYSRCAELAPKDVCACNGLAWFLATCPDAKYRDGQEAVRYATKACELTGWKDPVYFDTLAAAYADDGRFDKAVAWQEKALADPAALEKAVGKEELARARERLNSFRDRKPFREGP